MRITDGLRYQSVQRNLTRIQKDAAEASQQASTGQRLGQPSDDPIAAAELSRVRASLNTAAAQRDAIAMVRGDAELAESTLSQVGELMKRLRELAMQGANGSLSAEDRDALATETRGIKTEVLRLANTRGTRGYLFAGARTDSPAFDAAGAFQGDDSTQLVDIGATTPTAVSASGAQAFTAAGGRDVFADLDALANALDANDPAATAQSLDALDASERQVLKERARIGLVVDKLDTSNGVLEQLDTDLQKRGDALGTADAFEAYSRMTVLSQSLERAVAVSRQMLESASYWNR
ncbi:MAG TPA: flagellar hook-associated protein FlgL [Polyangiaceae bacterium]|nr:flagellar hook-associated protein FlgL [Polyangiaceae bacterium]